MSLTSNEKQAVRQWKKLCEDIQTMSIVDSNESELTKAQRIERARRDYGYFVEYYFPHYCTDKESGRIIPVAKFHRQAAEYLLRHRNTKAVFKWARGHAKSTNMDIFIPLWLKCQRQRQINVMVLVGKSNESANTLLGDIQAELQYNKRYINDFGVQYNAGSWLSGEFVTADGTAFFARGRGQSPRGLRYRNNRPDYIVIDDLDDDELVQNPKRVSELTDWVKMALFGCFGASGGRFVMVGNLISKNSVLNNIAQTDGVYCSEVNIIDKKGNPSWSEFWTKEKIDDDRRFMGYRAFEREYMNNPIAEGAVFRQDWIKWKKLPKLHEYDSIVAYCDPSFKGSTKNDYKAIKVWGKWKTELHNIKNFVRQCSVGEMVRWFYDFHESLPEGVICEYYMEANFMQDIILDEFAAEGRVRGYQLPIRADQRRKPDKFQRIEGVSPLWERGFVWYNEALKNDPDTLAGLEQTLAFEKGSRVHDDAPDADEGAIYILQKRTRVEEFEARIGRTRPSAKHQW